MHVRHFIVAAKPLFFQSSGVPSFSWITSRKSSRIRTAADALLLLSFGAIHDFLVRDRYDATLLGVARIPRDKDAGHV